MNARTPDEIKSDERALDLKIRFGEGAHNEPGEVGTYPRLVHSVCGHNGILPANRVGCGGAMYQCSEVYRCTDCGTPFHRSCAVKHFGLEHGRFDPEVKVSSKNPASD